MKCERKYEHSGIAPPGTTVTSPRLRGEVDFERSEKSGEGDPRYAQARGYAPSPARFARDLSPQAGRGKAPSPIDWLAG